MHGIALAVSAVETQGCLSVVLLLPLACMCSCSGHIYDAEPDVFGAMRSVFAGELCSLVQMVEETFVEERLWGAPTTLPHSVPTGTGPDQDKPNLTPQVLMMYAMLTNADLLS